VNIDAAPTDAGVTAHDVRDGLPYADDSFDVVYGSHVVEHVDTIVAGRLLRECLRVLKPAGIVRLVVPDLEAIVRLYLQSLEGALAGDQKAQQRYDWMMLELYDQAVRTSPGGKMGAYLRGARDEDQASFIASRIGSEAACATGRARRRSAGGVISAMRRRGAGLAAFIFLGTEGRQALQEGLFRRGGEVHQWMYDRFSMKRALEQAGFTGARARAADESAIPGFARYGLETAGGLARKPDSLYMEARKPSDR
jgi:SAM-dependent methyltransferase